MNADCTLGNGSLGTVESIYFVLEEGALRIERSDRHRAARQIIGKKVAVIQDLDET